MKFDDSIFGEIRQTILLRNNNDIHWLIFRKIDCQYLKLVIKIGLESIT